MTLTYPATLEQLWARVWRRLNSQDDGTAPDNAQANKVTDALNRTQRRLQQAFLMSFGDLYVTAKQVTPAANKIDVPQDLLRLIALERSVGSSAWVPVRIVPPHEHAAYQFASVNLDPSSQVLSTAETWSQFGDYFEAQSTATVSGNYRVLYWRRARDMQASTDTPDLPQEYHDVMVDGAAAEMARNQGALDRAALLEGQYEKATIEMRQFAATMNAARQSTIRRMRNRRSGYGSW